jgi:hypothetical protein
MVQGGASRCHSPPLAITAHVPVPAGCIRLFVEGGRWQLWHSPGSLQMLQGAPDEEQDQSELAATSQATAHEQQMPPAGTQVTASNVCFVSFIASGYPDVPSSWMVQEVTDGGVQLVCVGTCSMKLPGGGVHVVPSSAVLVMARPELSCTLPWHASTAEQPVLVAMLPLVAGQSWASSGS